MRLNTEWGYVEGSASTLTFHDNDTNVDKTITMDANVFKIKPCYTEPGMEPCVLVRDVVGKHYAYTRSATMVACFNTQNDALNNQLEQVQCMVTSRETELHGIEFRDNVVLRLSTHYPYYTDYDTDGASIHCICLSPCGSLLAVGTTGRVLVFSTDTCHQLTDTCVSNMSDCTLEWVPHPAARDAYNLRVGLASHAYMTLDVMRNKWETD